MRILSPRFLDRVEQVAALVFFSFLVARIWPENLQLDNLAPAVLLVSEGVVVLLLLIRRATADISLRPRDWAIAIASTVAPLLVVKGGHPIAVRIGVCLLLFGMVTHIAAKLTLRRSFGLVAANRGIKTGGPYRYVRHPMYLGYMISHVGFLLMAPALWNVTVYAVGWTLLVLRVAYEERLLARDEAYQVFMKQVPYRLIPGIY